MALLWLNCDALKREMARDIGLFQTELEKNINDYSKAVASRPELRLVAFYDGLSYINAIHSSLTTLKSLLDVYGKLMGKLIGRGQSWTFGKAKVGGEKLSGGAIINWLRKSAPRSYFNATILADLTEWHSRNWITEAVAYRDTITHHADILGMRHMSTRIEEYVQHRRTAVFYPPLMPNGRSVEAYIDDVACSLSRYIEASLPLLPDVDLKNVAANKIVEMRCKKEEG